MDKASQSYKNSFNLDLWTTFEAIQFLPGNTDIGQVTTELATLAKASSAPMDSLEKALDGCTKPTNPIARTLSSGLCDVLIKNATKVGLPIEPNIKTIQKHKIKKATDRAPGPWPSGPRPSGSPAPGPPAPRPLDPGFRPGSRLLP